MPKSKEHEISDEGAVELAIAIIGSSVADFETAYRDYLKAEKSWQEAYSKAEGAYDAKSGAALERAEAKLNGAKTALAHRENFFRQSPIFRTVYGGDPETYILEMRDRVKNAPEMPEEEEIRKECKSVKAHYKRRALRGECIYCGRKLDKGETHLGCAACRALKSEIRRERYHKQRGEDEDGKPAV